MIKAEVQFQTNDHTQIDYDARYAEKYSNLIELVHSTFEISPTRTRRPCGFTMKISSRRHRHLIYFVKEILKQTVWVPLRYEFYVF